MRVDKFRVKWGLPKARPLFFGRETTQHSWVRVGWVVFGGRDLRLVHVSFMDHERVRWAVTERGAYDVPGNRGIRGVIFASAHAMRRVWEYPGRWRDLLMPGLIALNWSR